MSTARHRSQPLKDDESKIDCENFIDDEEEEDDDHDRNKKSTVIQAVAVGSIFLLILLVFFKSRVMLIVSNFSSLSLNESIFDIKSHEQNIFSPDVELPVDNPEEYLKSLITVTPNIVSNINEIPTQISIEQQREKSENLIEKIRSMKHAGVVMEEDENAKSIIVQLQAELRKLMRLQYGPNTSQFKVEMKLEFPSSMPDYIEAGSSGRILIETAPIDLVPYSVYMFLQIAKGFKNGAFHRNAGHVLQAMITADGVRGMAFQEYHKDFPHKRLTMGYAGRPGGPAFYISTVDNSDNHGPGSQGSRTEADGCFGRVLEGEDVVKRMQKQPGKTKPSGFVDNPHNYIKILSFEILEPTEVLH